MPLAAQTMRPKLEKPVPVYDNRYRLRSVVPLDEKKYSCLPEKLAATMKLCNAARRRAAAMFGRGIGQDKHEYKKNHKGKPDKEAAYCDCTAKNLYYVLHA